MGVKTQILSSVKVKGLIDSNRSASQSSLVPRSIQKLGSTGPFIKCNIMFYSIFISVKELFYNIIKNVLQ